MQSRGSYASSQAGFLTHRLCDRGTWWDYSSVDAAYQLDWEEEDKELRSCSVGEGFQASQLALTYAPLSSTLALPCATYELGELTFVHVRDKLCSVTCSLLS